MNNLISRAINSLVKGRERILDGKINSIPSSFPRFRDDFLGVQQGRYVVVTSSTKGAKTQFASHEFIYRPLLYAYEHPEQIRIKIFYFPLEETPENIMVRFMSYLLFTKSGHKTRLSPTELRSFNNNPLNQEIIDILNTEEYQSILKLFEENVIFCSSTNPYGIYKECLEYAKNNGTVYTKKQLITDDFGVTKEVDVFDRYEANDPEEYRIVFIDHIGLIGTEKGCTLKQSIDKLSSEYCVKLRNDYNFSPVVIQQQAFVGENLDAFKENKLRPTIANLSDSKYPARDADMCLGLFSPFKYELKEYMGYDITKLRDNIRFLEVLINRNGSMGGIIGLYFDGAVNYFKELPKPDEVTKLTKIYDYLRKLRNPQPAISLLAFAKTLFKN